MKKSRVYKRQNKLFRYDYDHSLVCWVAKATADEIDDNKEWIEKYGKPLFDIDSSGYMEIQAVGLRQENWKNKKMRDSYLDMWIDEIEEESRCLMADFLRFG